MTFSVSDFRTKGLPGAGARPNLFSVNVKDAPKDLPLFPFLCKIATIPPSTLGVVEVPYFGRMIKVPGNRTFDNLSVTVINDEDFAVRNGIESWMNTLNSHKGNKSEYDAVSSFADIEISHYSRAGDDSLAGGGVWHFRDCFPVALGEIGLDWGSNDTIEEFTIDWAYDYWEHKDTS